MDITDYEHNLDMFDILVKSDIYLNKFDEWTCLPNVYLDISDVWTCLR